jgi:hypothetical protein
MGPPSDMRSFVCRNDVVMRMPLTGFRNFHSGRPLFVASTSRINVSMMGLTFRRTSVHNSPAVIHPNTTIRSLHLTKTHSIQAKICWHTSCGSSDSWQILVSLFIIISASEAQHELWPLPSRGFVITHNDAPQSVGLLWTSDQLVAETSTWQHTTHTTDRHPCLRWDSNPRSQQASGRRPTS